MSDEIETSYKEDATLKIKYRVTALDSDGEVVEERETDFRGGLGIERLHELALVHGARELEITPVDIKVVQNGEVIRRIKHKNHD